MPYRATTHISLEVACAWFAILLVPFQMPRGGVIETPAIGGGPRVSNVFQSNMVLPQD